MSTTKKELYLGDKEHILMDKYTKQKTKGLNTISVLYLQINTYEFLKFVIQMKKIQNKIPLRRLPFIEQIQHFCQTNADYSVTANEWQ